MDSHPCCGYSLQTGTKIVSILQIIGAVLILILGISALYGVAYIATDVSHQNDPSTTTALEVAVVIAGVISLIIVGIMSLILGILLFKGAQERHMWKCIIWIVVTSIVIEILILRIIVRISGGSFPLYDIYGVVFNLYFIWIVWAFIKELKSEVVKASTHGVCMDQI